MTQIFEYRIENFGSQFGVSHFATSELQRDLDLVTLLEKLVDVAHFGVEVTLADLWLELHLFHRDLNRLLARFLDSLRFFITKLAVVHNATYGWVCLSCYFNEIEFCLAGSFECLKD